MCMILNLRCTTSVSEVRCLSPCADGLMPRYLKYTFLNINQYMLIYCCQITHALLCKYGIFTVIIMSSIICTCFLFLSIILNWYLNVFI